MTLNLATRKSEGHPKKEMHLVVLEHDGRALNLLTSKKLFQKRMKTLPITKKCFKKKGVLKKEEISKQRMWGRNTSPGNSPIK